MLNTDAIDAFLEVSGLDKTASALDTAKQLGHDAVGAMRAGVIGGVGAAAAAGILSAGATSASALYDAATKHRDYKNMMQAFPDLQHRNPDDVQRAFTTVRSFAPKITKDPMTAGAAVNALLLDPQAAHGFVGGLTDIERKIQSPVHEMLMQGSLQGMRSGMEHDLSSKRDEARRKFDTSMADRQEAYQGSRDIAQALLQRERDDLSRTHQMAMSNAQLAQQKELSQAQSLGKMWSDIAQMQHREDMARDQRSAQADQQEANTRLRAALDMLSKHTQSTGGNLHDLARNIHRGHVPLCSNTVHS